jgi:uncharacterized surface protein with fasciclin (FAS1) repeats
MFCTAPTLEPTTLTKATSLASTLDFAAPSIDAAPRLPTPSATPIFGPPVQITMTSPPSFVLSQQNVLDTARGDPDLSLAVILFERAGLTEIFSCPGPFTVQFPTNSAVELVDASVLDFLLRPENQAELMNLMLYHVLPGEFPTSTLQPGPTRTLANAGTAEVIVSQNPTMFNGATVILADISACNGLINTLDAVLTFIPTCKTKKFCNWRIPTIDCHVSHFL